MEKSWKIGGHGKLMAMEKSHGKVMVPTISLDSHQNISLHTGASVNVLLLTSCNLFSLVRLVSENYNAIRNIQLPY